MYPAKSHARRTAEKLKETLASFGEAKFEDVGYIYLAGTKESLLPFSDQTPPFHQDRYFNYLSGAFNVPDSHLLYNIKTDKLTVFLPPIDYDDVMWSGLPLSPEQLKATTDADEVRYSTEIASSFLSVASQSKLATLGIETSAEFPEVVASPALLEALDECRMIKDDYEIDLIRKANEITANAHHAVMSALPIEKTEGHVHAEFVYHAMRQGAKLVAYDPICCSGTAASTLHYVRNDQPLDGKQLVLIDAGAEWQLYAADVTRVFPINGHWTKEAKAIYQLVWKMQDEVMKKLKAGVLWDDLHFLSHRVLVEGLQELGILRNEFTVEEIMNSRVSVSFYAHGLGHMLGMNTHDTGGKANYADADPMMRYLRIRRRLEPNMVVTVEPGCYFNDFQLEPALKDPAKSKYIDQDVLANYWAVGGVRIEDDVLVTKDGCESLTNVVKDADEVAQMVQDGIAKGRSHFHVLV